MAIIYRAVKGAQLTSDEVDANFAYLEGNIQIIPDVTYQWIVGTLSFNVWATRYPVNGVAYSAVGTVTLDAADGTFGRYDAIIATSLNTVSKITGTPSGTPALPDIDDSTEYLVTYIFVPSGATQPGNIGVEDIYLENTEWTTAETTSGARIALASANDPDTGTVSIESTSPINKDQVSFTAPSSIAYNAFTALVLRIKLKAALPANARIRALWYLNTTVTSTSIDLNVDNTNTSTYQTIIISQENFAFFGLNINKLVIEQFKSCLGWFIDNVQYQTEDYVDPTPSTEVILATKESFIASASQTIFGLSNIASNVEVWVDRVYQIEDTDYTYINGTVILSEGAQENSIVNIRKY